MHKVADIDIQHNITKANKKIADRITKKLNDSNIFGVDFVGAIGSGKTSLIEELILNIEGNIGVIAGDVISKFDVGRFKKFNIPVVGLNTGKECHIDAHLVEHAIEEIPLDSIDYLLIENVGNLICPVDFDLGSNIRVVIISVSEGDDTVEKHPLVFQSADLVIINKIDIADAVGADVEKMVKDVEILNPDVEVIKTSLKKGIGLDKIIYAIEDFKKKIKA